MIDGRGRVCADRRAHGFTLVELIIVVAIIAVSAAIAIPAVQSGRHQREVRGTLQHFVAAVREASSKAVLTRRTVELWISPDDNFYALAMPTQPARTDEEGEEIEEERPRGLLRRGGKDGTEDDLADLARDEARQVVGRVNLSEAAAFGEVNGGRALQDEVVAIAFYPTGGSGGGEVEFVFERGSSRQSYTITIDPLISSIDLKEAS